MNPSTLTAVSARQASPRKRFLWIFLGVIGTFYLVNLSPWVDGEVVLPIIKLSARIASAILNGFGAQTQLVGVVIRGPSFSVAVRRGCDPIDPIVLITAAILAFPATWGQRLGGFLIGSTILLLLNVVRIVTLYWMGNARWPGFYSVHQEWWPAVFILAVVLLWLLWLKWIRSAASRNHA